MSNTRRIGVLTGSFDPITSGHVDLIRRSAELFDEVWVAVSVNASKNGLFTPEERLELVELALSELAIPNVHAGLCHGLVSDFMRDKNARFLVRGVRNAVDFDYENDLSQIMRRFDSSFETVLLPARPEIAAVSSTYVRELLRYGCPLGDAVPECVARRMMELYGRK